MCNMTDDANYEEKIYNNARLQTFIVRQSSKPDTRALSVRLPPDKGPYIQHYLIEIHNEGTAYSLEASDNRFDNLPALIAYYSQCW